MDGSGAWLLCGERTLWTGRPDRAGTTMDKAGGVLYVTVMAIVLAIYAPSLMHTMPGIIQAMALLTVGAAVLQALGMLVNLFVITPRTMRRMVYEVTNYRIAVVRGQRVASVYLDQIDEPALRRNRNGTSDVLVRAPAAGSWLGSTFRSNGFGLAVSGTVTKLPWLAEATDARQVIASARQRMIDREIDVPDPSEYGTDPAPPSVVSLGPGERVLWAGAPASIPWWFGGNDVYFSAFGLVWLAFVAGMGIFVTQNAPPASLVLLVPFALVGIYLTAGRVVLRRLRIRSSRYSLTTHRLITTWRPLRGDAPIVVQESLSVLDPPSVRDGSIFTTRTSEDPSLQRNGYKELTWPATTAAPPAFVGLQDPQQVCALIGAAQLAGRLP